MLKFYLRLQATRIHRKVQSLGGYPVLNYSVIVAVFLAVSYIFQSSLEHWGMIYAFMALGVVNGLNNSDYTDFLKYTYSKADFHRIRVIENVVAAIPFMLFLSINGKAIFALILLPGAVLLAFLGSRRLWHARIPTPFGKYPFEFIVGFRVAFIVFTFTYALAYKALQYHNYGIGIFALLLSCMVCTAFYGKVEDYFYVWIFSDTPRQFLLTKLKTAIASTLLLCLPIVIALMVSNPGKIHIILAFQLIGLGYVCAGVVCKYATFPGDISVKEGLLVVFSILFPPLLLVSIPLLYKRSLRSLEGILA